MPDDSGDSCHRAAQHELASLQWVFPPGGIRRSRPLALTRSPRRVLAAARGACLLLLAAAAVVLAEGEGEEEKRGVRLLDAGRLEKFVDGLPDMPVLSGYGVADGGRLVPGELTVGMYDTTWLKYIMPEAIVINKILLRDDKTCCMKPDLQVNLLVDSVEDSAMQKGETRYSALRRMFRQRLVDFFRKHPEQFVFCQSSCI